MKDGKKTKEQLINELVESRQRIAELEASEAEHQRAEEALRESQETLRALFDASTDVVALIDTRGTVLEINEAAACRFGKTRDEIIGSCWLDWLPPELAKAREAHADEVARTGQPSRAEGQRHTLWRQNHIYS